MLLKAVDDPSFIVDCSLTMAWCFADEATSDTDTLLSRLAGEAALVPHHWALEVGNVLLMAEKRGRISAIDASRFVMLLDAFAIQVDATTTTDVFGRILPLRRLHRLTSYDAAYLELALRHSLPLATLDDDLRKAAQSVGILLLGK